MLLKDKKVAIIGAGPVGLTMARLLQQKGIDVTVYERDKDPLARIWGGTLDLHRDTGQVALRQAGLLDQYYARALPMGIILADAQGNILSAKGLMAGQEHDNPEINRNELRKMLLDSLKPGTVNWDSQCSGIAVQDGKWLLRFSHQPAASADLVIGANGGMSGIRSDVTDTLAEETGTFMIQGDVPQPELNCPDFYRWCNGHRIMAAFQGNLLVANPLNGDVLSYGLIFRKPGEGTDISKLDFTATAGLTAWLSERFSRWDERYHELFRSTSFYAGLTTKVLPLGKPWKTDRPLPVTLIGDAAHLMPPFAGQGVNTGLMDAAVLSANLTGDDFGTIHSAISDYEQQMFGYAIRAQRQSRENELEMRDPGFSFDRFIQ